jgi:hypothetical protein
MKLRKHITKPLGSPKIFFYSLFWLVILLFWGTVAQKEMGLYQAQIKFFSSWFFWIGPLPLPSGRLTMALITFNLFFKLVFNSPLSLKRTGIIITHCGSMMLLGGGVITAYFSSEGNLVVNEGEKASFYSDYHENELAVIDTRPEDVDHVTAFHGANLSAGSTLNHERLPFSIKILKYYPNARFIQKEGPTLAEERTVASRFDIEALPLSAEEATNRAGARIHIEGVDDNQDGIYLLFEYMEVPQQLKLADGTVLVELRKKTYPLPFEIELLDFEEQKHPGTTMARSFKSDIHLIKDGIKREVTISMNAPLRSDSYTLYQSSFARQNGTETSVLAVVQNAGRLFPYISSIIICIGIFIHLVIQLPLLIRRI